MVQFGDAGYQDDPGYEMDNFLLTVAEGAPQPYQVLAGTPYRRKRCR
jgi:hypothetical protein